MTKAKSKPVARRSSALKAEAVRKADVIGPIEREGERLLRLARDLGEEGATRPLVDDWSVRDVVAHCVYWQGMLARMMGAPLPLPNWIPRWQSEHQLGTDDLNRLTVEHYRALPFKGVLDDFHFTAGLVRTIVDEMKEENLMLPAGEPWGADTPVWKAIGGETHGHWKEHADELEVRLARARPAGATSGARGARPAKAVRGAKAGP